MELSKDDFSYTYNADGYMIQYKGQNLGGASVMLPRSKTLHWQHARQNVRDNKESCEREINHVLNGRGQARFMEQIKRIDCKI